MLGFVPQPNLRLELCRRYNESLVWLTALTIYCSEKHKNIIKQETDKLNHAISEVTGNMGIAIEEDDRRKVALDRCLRDDNIPNLLQIIISSYKVIVECARQDIGVINN